MRLSILLTLLIAVTLVGAQLSAARTAPSVLVEARAEGGLCPYGMCRSSAVLTVDGRLIRNGKLERRISETRLRALRALIAAVDLADVKRHPFTGTCPITYDGAEWIYRFRGVPAPLRSCTLDLDRVAAVQLVQRTLSGT